MALNSTVTSGFDLVKQLQQWSRNNFRQNTIFCTIDVTDHYTMVPQIEGVLSLRKMLDQLKLKQVANIGSTVNFLDLSMKNQDGQLCTTVYRKPSYEPYYLPFNSIHPLHMKKNIPFAMLLRGIRYCSTFQTYLN
ncbi:unnamed protein product [Rotaria magnacalcarata]|uniref:Helix-turn-helix domain-containing protein n=1 Tax=Rotaria magnacalcarata TaxID=392030 RepID=A0A815Z9V1_9BILA|nr:unnamed protein product [Rotaria magnacalcarata]CAF1580777.1 unnamed protein product [Rotaria magnacalcarata]CAF3824467.1 unnamed protein product [Rotaria magnacalcarata]CAF3885032.1 unnamed protein product [Rotaria magnacalcarata]CAF3901317.1 unnamed protein product [Rotaria magnacalcarata]